MTVARYDAVAEAYSMQPDSYNDNASVALLNLVGTIKGKRVLDLACGHGRLARELARRGASVVGVDLSNALLDRARQLEESQSLGIRYVHADACSPNALGGEVFDEVVCGFGLTDIDDLDGALATVERVLRQDGALVFSLLHPCFPGGQDVSGSWPSESSYYEEKWWLADAALSLLRQQVGANHRMLSTYLNSFRAYGLVLDNVVEPQPETSWSEKRGDAGRFPVFLVGRCIKRGDRS